MGSHGGSLIYISCVSYTSIQLITNLDAVAVQLNLNRRYIICSLYLSRNGLSD